MDTILATLDTLEIGEPVAAANLTMFPLLLPEDTLPAYLTLDEALAGGLASVTEVSESGSVPELLVKNRAPQPILILDGEELVGAKQNRIVNLSILVPARETLHIPVSCVEAVTLDELVHRLAPGRGGVEQIHPGDDAVDGEERPRLARHRFQPLLELLEMPVRLLVERGSGVRHRRRAHPERLLVDVLPDFALVGVARAGGPK